MPGLKNQVLFNFTLSSFYFYREGFLGLVILLLLSRRFVLPGDAHTGAVSVNSAE